MGRSDADSRPPIEILGADLGIDSTQQVALGPRRRKPGRGRSLAVAFGVVVLLVGGLVLGGGDDTEGAGPQEERDNQERIDLDKSQTSTTRATTTTRPTTTTTTTLPLGPPFGEPVEGVLLVTSGSSWTKVDLTTGEVARMSMPPADEFSAVAVGGGIAMPLADEVQFFPVLGAGEDPQPVSLGPGDQVRRAGPDQVWLLDHPPEDGTDPSITDVRLVDLTGEVLRSFRVPGRYQAFATADEVLVGRGGRVYVADESGTRPVAVGYLNGTFGDDALVTACDEEAACTLRRQPTDGGSSRTLLEIEDPDLEYHEAVTAPDGRVAVVGYAQSPVRGNRITLFDPSGGRIAQIDDGVVSVGASLAPEGTPQWLPGDLGLVVRTSGALGWLRRDGSDWRLDEIPLLAGNSDASLFIVTP